MLTNMNREDLVRKHLRETLANGPSLRELDRRLGRSQNYVSRLLRGDLAGLTFDSAFEILKAAGMSVPDFLKSLADTIAETEKVAVAAEKSERQARATAQFLELIDKAALKAALQPIVEELAEEALTRQRQEK